MDHTFKEMVTRLVSDVLSPDKLPVKTVNGQQITVSGLLEFFQVYILYTTFSLLISVN